MWDEYEYEFQEDIAYSAVINNYLFNTILPDEKMERSQADR